MILRSNEDGYGDNHDDNDDVDDDSEDDTEDGDDFGHNFIFTSRCGLRIRSVWNWAASLHSWVPTCPGTHVLFSSSENHLNICSFILPLGSYKQH